MSPSIALYLGAVSYGAERQTDRVTETAVLRSGYQRGLLSEAEVLRVVWTKVEQSSKLIPSLIVELGLLEPEQVNRIVQRLKPPEPDLSALTDPLDDDDWDEIDQQPAFEEQAQASAEVEFEPEPEPEPEREPEVKPQSRQVITKKRRKLGAGPEPEIKRPRRLSSGELPRPTRRSLRASGAELRRPSKRARRPSDARAASASGGRPGRRSSGGMDAARPTSPVLIATLVGGAVVVLVSIGIFVSRGGPPKSRKRRTAQQQRQRPVPEKNKPSSKTEPESRPVAPPRINREAAFAAKFKRAAAAVDKALAAGDFDAASNAMADLRFALTGNGAQKWRDRAYSELQKKINKAVDQLLATQRKKFDALIAAGKLNEAETLLSKLQVNITGHDALFEEMDKKLGMAQYVAAQPKTAPVQPTKHLPPRDRTKELASARKRLAEAKLTLAMEREERAALVARRAARVILLTKDSSLRLKLAGVDLGPCKVTEYTELGVRIEGAQVGLKLTWNQLPRAAVYSIRKAALSEQDAQGWYDLGRFMTLQKRFREGAYCFKMAVKANPELKKRVPDLKALAERPKPFKCDYKRIGADILRLRWDFKKAEQAADFEFKESKKLKVGKGLLSLTGRNNFFCYLKQEIKFERQVAIRATGMGGTAEAVIGLRFFLKEKWLTLLVVRDPKDNTLTLYRETETSFVPHVKQSWKYNPSLQVALVMDGGTLTLFSGKTKLWSGIESNFQHCWPVLGGFSTKKTDVTATFRSVEIEGRVPPKWFSQSALEEEARMFRALEFDLDVTDLEAEDKLPEIRLDELPSLSGAANQMFQAGLAAMRQGFKENSMNVLVVGIQLMAQAAELAPNHPGVQFYLGFGMERLGEGAEALAAYRKAVENKPDLVAAHLRMASMLPNLFEYEQAEAAVERVLDLEPANAMGYLQRGLIRFYKTSDAKALDDLELARVLAPKDVAIRKAIKDVKHVMAGPSFPPQIKKIRRTKHYKIISDLDSKTVSKYAKHMEAIHAHYTAFFKPKNLPERRSEVLLFRTREGYQTYAELTTNDRAESTLGYYHPHYHQLLIFQGLDPEQTLRVMYHEAFHQYVHQLIPLIPIWLNEGMAEYFGASEVKKGKVVRTGLIQHGRLSSLRAGIKMGFKPLDFKKIMLMSQGEFYGSSASLYYAQAWSMVHFFFSQPKLKQVLVDYLEALRKRQSPKQAFEATFGKEDLVQAKKDWRRHLDGMK